MFGGVRIGVPARYCPAAQAKRAGLPVSLAWSPG